MCFQIPYFWCIRYVTLQKSQQAVDSVADLVTRGQGADGTAESCLLHVCCPNMRIAILFDDVHCIGA